MGPRSKHQRVRLHILETSMNVLGDNHVVDGLLALLRDRRGFCWTDALFKTSAVGSLSVSPRGRTDNAIFEKSQSHQYIGIGCANRSVAMGNCCPLERASQD